MIFLNLSHLKYIGVICFLSAPIVAMNYVSDDEHNKTENFREEQEFNTSTLPNTLNEAGDEQKDNFGYYEQTIAGSPETNIPVKQIPNNANAKYRHHLIKLDIQSPSNSSRSSHSSSSNARSANSSTALVLPKKAAKFFGYTQDDLNDYNKSKELKPLDETSEPSKELVQPQHNAKDFSDLNTVPDEQKEDIRTAHPQQNTHHVQDSVVDISAIPTAPSHTSWFKRFIEKCFSCLKDD